MTAMMAARTIEGAIHETIRRGERVAVATLAASAPNSVMPLIWTSPSDANTPPTPTSRAVTSLKTYTARSRGHPLPGSSAIGTRRDDADERERHDFDRTDGGEQHEYRDHSEDESGAAADRFRRSEFE
jgi:hypothetical protein